MRSIAACILFLLSATVWAASPACMRDCARAGYDYGYCAGYCDQGSPAPDVNLPMQPGTPGNGGFDAIPDPVPKRQPAYRPGNAYSVCLTDCRQRGYDHRYCQNYCRY
jgi:hypothetical protein